MNEAIEVDGLAPDYCASIATQVLATANDNGADASEVAVAGGDGLSVTVRGGACEMIEHQRDKSLAVTVYKGGSKGTATTSDFSLATLRGTVLAASRIADYAESDECAGLAEAGFLATDILDLDLDHPWTISPENAIDVALDCERVAVAGDKRIKQSDGCSVNRYRGIRAYANSHGFCAAYRATQNSISSVMIAEDGDGMQRGYWYTATRNADELEDAEAVGRMACERTVAKLGARKIVTTELPVLFEARVAASLIGHLISAISGGAQYRRASFLLDALGEQVLPDFVTLDEQPHLPRGMGSAPFDDDGVATTAKECVKKGRLETYLLSAYAARRLGREPSGNAGGVHNLAVSHGGRDFDQLVASLERGLIVTDLIGFGVNGVTGDYSRGASGFLVERGEIVQPVEEITIAGNLKEILLGIREVGSDTDYRGTIHTGSILVDSMAVAGR